MWFMPSLQLISQSSRVNPLKCSNKIHKINIYHSGVLDFMSIITPEILIYDSVKASLYMMTILCSTGS